MDDLKKRIVSGIVFALLLVGMFTLTFNIQPVKAGTIIVPDDYPTIQEAINAANPEDTVFVKAGIYYENVIVNKTVSLIGENRETTIVDCGFGCGLRIASYDHLPHKIANITISKFTIRNAGMWGAIFLEKATSCNISNNNLIDSVTGIYLLDSDHNTIFANVMKNNERGFGLGVYVDESDYNNVSCNKITDNYGGISLSSSTDNIINGNDVSNNSGTGVSLDESNHNVISFNNVEKNQGLGISLYKSVNNAIQGNNIRNNSYDGIKLDICLPPYPSLGNIIVNNNVISNGLEFPCRGIYSYFSGNNLIYHNNFINNARQVEIEKGLNTYTNTWDNGYPSGGNYWSDYTGIDANGDAIGDTSYEGDRFPLIAPFNTFDAGVWNDEAYNVDVISNSNISDFHFNPDEGAFLNFDVTGEDGTSGFCRVTIPADLLWVEDGWIITVGDQQITNYTIIPDENFTYLYFTYNHSTQTVTIEGTHVIPEFPSSIALLEFLMLITISLIFAEKKTLQKAKT